MEKYIIGVDLDSTLVKAKSIEQASAALGYEFTDKHAIVWNHHNFPQELRAAIFALFDDPHVMCDLADPIEGAQTKIKQWSDQGHKIVLITARNKPVHEATVEMVRRQFPEIEDINFVPADYPKVEVMKEKGVQIWVDDAPHGVRHSLEMGLRTFMISNNYTKYNWEEKTAIEQAVSKGMYPGLFNTVKLVYDINL